MTGYIKKLFSVLWTLQVLYFSISERRDNDTKKSTEYLALIVNRYSYKWQTIHRNIYPLRGILTVLCLYLEFI